jgi:hypothetical protein
MDHVTSREIRSAAQATAAAQHSQEAARKAAIPAIRELERQTVEALGGAHLQGLCSIVPRHGGPAYFAANVRADHPDAPLMPYVRQLVIGRDGRLWCVTPELEVHVGMVAEQEPARDEDLTADDLEPYARALREVLRRHAERADRATDRYARVLGLARSVWRGLGAVA